MMGMGQEDLERATSGQIRGELEHKINNQSNTFNPLDKTQINES